VAKYDWNGSGWSKTTYRDDYTTSAAGNTNVATWTAAPEVAGIVAKAGTSFATFNGGTFGTIRSSEIGAGKNAISHFFLCGNHSYPAPVCNLSSTPNSIALGENAVLSWTTVNAREVSFDQGIGSVPLNGSYTVAPSTNTSYTLTAIGDGGTAHCSKTVTVVTPKLCILEITKTGPENMSVGDTLTYSVNFKNIGNGDCTGGGVKVVDVLPQGVTFISETHSSNVTAGYLNTPVYNSANHTVNWNAGTLTPGESGWVEVTAKIDTPTMCGDYSIQNRAKITAYELNNFKTWVESNSVSTTIDNDCAPTAPTCLIIATPGTITAGESSVLTWSSERATSATISGGIGTVETNGTLSVSPQSTTDYTFSVTGIGGSAQCTVTVVVTDVPPNPPSCSLSIDPFSIAAGEETELSWTTSDADIVSIDQSIGVVAATGTRTLNPLTDTTYTLTATRSAQNGFPEESVTCVASVNVENEPEPVLACDAFTASPGTLTAAGTTTLTWATSNATNVTISGNVGAVTEDGSQNIFVGTSTVFTLTATRGSESVQCTAPVTIIPEPEVVVPKCVAFSVSPSSVRRGGSVELRWQTNDATSVSINNGIGNVPLSGARQVTVDANTTYTLTATNADGTDSCQTTVTTTSSSGGGGGSSAPRCELTASKRTIAPGEVVTLAWNNLRTDDITLEDNRGNMLVDSEDDSSIDEDEGSIVVRPTQSTSYTLTVMRGSRERDCTVDINVTSGSGVSVSSTRTQDPLVAGISLSRVPYTGFDAGPVLTAIFYSLLLLWGFSVAYILVIRNKPTLREMVPTLPHPKDTLEPVIRPSATALASHALMNTPIARSRSAALTATVVPTFDVKSTTAPVIGYESLYTDIAAAPAAESTHVESTVESVVSESVPNDESDLAFLEGRAHDHNVLISSDALRFIMSQSMKRDERVEVLDLVINVAKKTYPSEDGWVILNKERILSLLK
jgi:uncharacterized repeat protein (TIGR01451 family)